MPPTMAAMEEVTTNVRMPMSSVFCKEDEGVST